MRCYTDGSVLPIGGGHGRRRARRWSRRKTACAGWWKTAAEYPFGGNGSALSYTTTDRQVISNASSYLTAGMPKTAR